MMVGVAVVAALVTAPTAAADPVWPVGGAEPADATISDLQEQGYTVQVNWVSGYPTVPLSECWVDDIHNPNGTTPPGENTLAIVYVDIGCPSNNID
ncbi:MAG: hypothetical protein JO191_10370 [Mycobacteriaceae bacterium]|nr:hypothetical protein [Mycobacteriaceae bacterium]MBV9515505.1 hypothetical protein [Mycobacteriaceae bacterium]